ncbi:hypothetical protein HDV00_011528, partial [Rhizophlyctis rosea]
RRASLSSLHSNPSLLPPPPPDSTLTSSRRGSRSSIPSNPDTYEIDVVTIRKVSNGWMKVGGAGFDTHYLISTKNNGVETIVGRRWVEAKQLIKDLRLHHPQLSLPPLPPRPKTSNQELPLPHERARQILRHYLRTLISSHCTPTTSHTLHRFLCSNPTSLSPSELADAEERGKLDEERERERKVFEDEAEGTARELQERLREVKRGLLGAGGLERLVECLRGTSQLEELPREYLMAVEWGKLK